MAILFQGIVILLSFIVSITTAHPLSQLVARQTPQDPSQDPFYKPPVGFESTQPGTILRQRSVQVSFFSTIPNPVEAHQLLYRTTAVNGSAIAAVTTIFKPLFPKNDRFISFHTAYDTSSVSCDPSYQYQLGANQAGPLAGTTTNLEILIIQLYLSKGYVVSSPDYEGPDAAFAPGRLEGMVTLDSMRAVVNYGSSVGLSAPNPMIIGAGYSGGAIASGWGASLQPSYAPELNIKGWAHGGTPANLTGTLMYINKTPNSGFILPSLSGLAKPSAYGAELQPVLDQYLTPLAKQLIQQADTQCTTADLDFWQYQSIFNTSFQTMGDNILQEPTIASVLSENIMGVHKTETPIVPMFVYHATQDEIIPYANVTTLVNSWCDNGATVKFTTYAHGGHATTDVVALPDIMNFVEAAFSGSTVQGCQRNTKLNSIFDIPALLLDIEPLGQAIAQWLHDNLDITLPNVTP